MLEDRCETQSNVVSFIRPVSSPESHHLCKNLSPNMSSYSCASCRKGRRGESHASVRSSGEAGVKTGRPAFQLVLLPQRLTLRTPFPSGPGGAFASSGLIILIYRSLRQGIGLSLPGGCGFGPPTGQPANPPGSPAASHMTRPETAVYSMLQMLVSISQIVTALFFQTGPSPRFGQTSL